MFWDKYWFELWNQEESNREIGKNMFTCPTEHGEEFALGIDPKSLHATVLMQTVYNAVVWHSGGFLKRVAISVT